MKRFVEIEVTKTLYSSVYVELDDTDPRFAGWFKDGKLDARRALDRIGTSLAKETLDDYDWDDHGDNINADGYKEIPESEAAPYEVIDLCEMHASELPDRRGMTPWEREAFERKPAGMS